MAKIFSLFLRFMKIFSLKITGISTTSPTANRIESVVSVESVIVSQIQRTTMNELQTYDPNALSTYNSTTLVNLDYTIL